MVLTAMLPLLILFVIFIMTAIFISRNINRKGQFFSRKRVQFIVVGYVVVLLISTVLSLFIPTKESTLGERVQIENLDLVNQQFYQAVHEGRVDEVDRTFLNKEWSFQYDEDQLQLVIEDDENIGISILVERKENNDNLIEAAYYQTPAIINDQDITEYIKPLDFQLSKDLLTVVKSRIRGAYFFHIY